MSSTIDTTTRRVPPLGGFNLTVLGIEVRRMLRNRRTIIFTLIFPAALFFAIGSGTGWQEKVGHGTSRPTSWSRWRCTAPRSPPRPPGRWWPPSGLSAGPASCASRRCTRPSTSA